MWSKPRVHILQNVVIPVSLKHRLQFFGVALLLLHGSFMLQLNAAAAPENTANEKPSMSVGSNTQSKSAKSARNAQLKGTKSTKTNVESSSSAVHGSQDLPERCLAYRFQMGDSLVYRVTTIDTIQFSDAPWLIKEREELISLVCDVIDPLGRMYLRQDLRSMKSKERQAGEEKATTRTSSAWFGRTAYIVIDSTGKRILAKQLDTIHASMGPGGAFQPPLLLSFLDTSCHVASQHRGWMMEHTDTLAENSVPYPLVNQLFNCAVRDTVFKNEPCHAIDFGVAAQGGQTTIGSDIGVYTRSVINSWGMCIFSKKESVPLVLSVHSDLKLWVNTERSEHKGQQRSHTRYERIFFSRRNR